MENNDSYKDLSLIIAEKQKVIDKLIHDKNSLLKIISHDIRAPFNQLFALLQLMEMEMPNMAKEGKDFIDKMYQSIICGMEMVKNLHDSRAIDQNNIPINKQNINLNSLVEQSINGFKIILRIKEIQINFSPDDSSIEIITDRMILRKMLDCILSNSIKFSNSKTRISVRLIKREDHFEIKIVDEGQGIKEEELDHIFNKYSKLSTRPTMGESTSGLGMYLTKQFADMLGYEIRVVNSTKTEGLEVKIIIPDLLDYPS